MIENASPFPLDGGRAGVGGGRADPAAGGAQGVVDSASRDNSGTSSAFTPTQPSPIEGEGSRFARSRLTAGQTVNRARRLRASPTRTEAKLWQCLSKLPVRFRRQAPIGAYVADFVCHPAALVVEVDGGVHSRTDVALRDLTRDEWFAGQGYIVLRFTTRQVEDDVEAVLTTIRNAAGNRLGKAV